MRRGARLGNLQLAKRALSRAKHTPVPRICSGSQRLMIEVTMTMPGERTRSIIHTGDFLRHLSKNPSFPESIRREANICYATIHTVWIRSCLP